MTTTNELDLTKLGFAAHYPPPTDCVRYYTRCRGWKPQGSVVEYVKYRAGGVNEYFRPGRDLNGRDDFRATFKDDKELCELLE